MSTHLKNWLAEVSNSLNDAIHELSSRAWIAKYNDINLNKFFIATRILKISTDLKYSLIFYLKKYYAIVSFNVF